MKNKKKGGLIILESYKSFFEYSTDQDAGVLIKMLVMYYFDDKEPDEVPNNIKALYYSVKCLIDQHKEKYKEKCKSTENSKNKKKDAGQGNKAKAPVADDDFVG